MLDWRFFILNKEKDIFSLTRKLWSCRPLKGQGVVSSAAHLDAFVPDVIREAVATGRISAEDQQEVVSAAPAASSYRPIISKFDAAVVFLDASGFTALTEALARRTRGAEEIGAHLNGFFAPLIEIVRRLRGDILKFSGDAITILWRVHAFEDAAPEETMLAARESAAVAAASAACRCCLEVQEKVQAVGQTPLAGITLAVHIGVGFGRLSLLQLGGLVDRWEYCAAGVPLEEVAVAEPLAKPGETVLSPSITQLIGLNNEHGLRVAPGGEDLPPGFSRLLGITAPSELRMPAMNSPCPQGLDARMVMRYIPSAIRTRLDTDHLGYDAEMRRIAVIFLSIKGLNPGHSDSDASRTQLIMRLFQRSVYALEGSINKFMVDDKGMVLLVVFGLPPVNHFTDDPIRAVLTATRLCDTLHDEGLAGQAGVATGTCWCGVVGSALRREYTVLGDTVNLSARLMANAMAGTVLVDAATHEACQSFLEFRPLGAISLKGKSKQVEVFRFTGKMLSRVVRREKQTESKLLSWEGWPVWAELRQVLERQLSHDTGPGGIVFVRGSPGSGKTEAVTHIERWAKSKNFALLFGQNMNPTSTFAVPRLCWQEVFGTLLEAASADPYWSRHVGSNGLDKSIFKASSELYQLVLTMLIAAGAEKDLLSWAPLLSFVLPGINFGAKGVSALLERDEQRTQGPPRLAQLCSLLLESFTAASSNTNGTVVLVHKKSGTSVYRESYVHDENIARAIGELCLRRRRAAGGRPLILCVVSRECILPDGWLASEASRAGGLVVAGDLDRATTEQYMAHLLRAPAGVAPCLVDHVYDACGGNPFSVETLSRQLESVGVLRWSEEGRAVCARDGQLQELPYPEDLKGMALASFEKLKTKDQLLLKTAAVCCSETTELSARNEFNALDLALYIGTSSIQDIEAQCSSLVDQRIFAEVGHVPVAGGEQMPGRSFKFVSLLLQHVASTLVLEVQKQVILSRAKMTARPSALG